LRSLWQRMLSSKIETDDTTRKSAKKGKDLGVVRRAGRGDDRDGHQNDHDDQKTNDRRHAGLQLPNTTLNISKALTRTARQPFLRDNLLLH
jgi:hypothetical protein